MTTDEWRQVTDEVAALWGRNARWAKATDAYRYARSIPFAAAIQAVETIYLENRKHAPAPADVLATAQHLVTDVATTEQVQAYCTASRHLWAIVGATGGVRTVICARCHREEEGAHHLYPTEAELEDGTFAGINDPTADQIAP